MHRYLPLLNGKNAWEEQITKQRLHQIKQVKAVILSPVILIQMTVMFQATTAQVIFGWQGSMQTQKSNGKILSEARASTKDMPFNKLLTMDVLLQVLLTQPIMMS